MANVHPTLESVAWAISRADDEWGAWSDYLPEARAAVNALADEAPEFYHTTTDWLREVAAEPKPPTVESVLRNRCLLPERNVELVAKQLRDAGLVNE